ncbi:hypothetical protein T06_7636 [Trichinella sp. T6]|nr:hypothetical protein T06_3176 [Trichinella sp. T6]KRX62179.1 hypothetical protein T06_7636 [Trichinella sp. T6]
MYDSTFALYDIPDRYEDRKSLSPGYCCRTIAPLNACHCSNRAQDCFSMT